MQPIFQAFSKYPLTSIILTMLFFIALVSSFILALIPLGILFLLGLEPNDKVYTKKTNFSIKHDANPTMPKEEKQAYLKSKHWKRLKDVKLTLAHNKCENCGSTKKLELHHNTYRNLGNENLSDLNILCRTCHQKLHDKLGYDRFTQYPISKLKE